MKDDDALLPFLPAEIRQRHVEMTRYLYVAHMASESGQELPPEPPGLRLQQDECLAAAGSAAAECGRLLKTLSPRAAIPLDIDATTGAALSRTGFLNRARWVLAVTAAGESLDPVLINDYYTQAASWWALEYLADIYRHTDSDDADLAISVDAMPGRQFMARTSSMAVRYHWACKKIATQIVREIHGDPEFAHRLPEFTFGNLDRIFAAVRRHHDGDLPIDSADNKGMELADLMAQGEGSLQHLSFEQAAKNSLMETKPFVRYDDGLLPCPSGQILFALERPLLAAADIQLTRSKAEKPLPKGVDDKINKGELFERAAHTLIIEAIGHECRQVPRGYKIKVATEEDPTDVDIALIDNTIQALGEVKAYETPNPDSAASRSYEKDLKYVYKQLHERLTALDNGIPLEGSDGTHYHGADALGLGVVLHPYNSSLGDPRMLKYVTGQADTTRVAVADLHAWLLVLHGLEDIDDLRSYLQFREEFRQVEAYSVEECDMALPYFHPNRTYRDAQLASMKQQYAQRDPSEKLAVVMTTWSVETEVALDTKVPKDRRHWRRKMFRDCF